MPEPPRRERPAPDIPQTIQKAVGFHQQGRLTEAEQLYQAVLAAQPDQFDALHFLGILRAQQGNSEAAVKLISTALERNPGSADAHCNLGNAYQELKRYAEAIASYDRALAISPLLAAAQFNRGNALQALHRRDEALASYDQALAAQPDYAQALTNRGNILQELGRLAEAIVSYDRALAIEPRDAEALNGRGSAAYKLSRHEEALASYDRALALRPDHVQAHNNRGNVLQSLGRYTEALECYDKALAITPDVPEVLNNRGHVLVRLKRYEDVIPCYARLLEIVPDYSFAKGELLHAKMQSCNWAGLMPLAESVEQDIQAGRKAAEPFGHQAISRSAQTLRRCAEIYAADKYPRAPVALWQGERYENARIRIGYLAGEFRLHAVCVLMVGLYEHHDKRRFELFAFDNGGGDGSVYRRRVEAAFDELVDIRGLGDLEAASAIRQRKIDILVNLNGYFGDSRQGVFAHRPSPVQVNYLGFPATLGADYIDYILADRHIIPPEDRDCYTEQVVYLPDCYQMNDSRRRAAERTPSRAELGLPDTGFVFCCFNNNYKFTPEIFDIWMRLLKAVPGSVLWVLTDNAAAGRNLKREAEKRGVAPGRVVLAPRMIYDEHLARHRLADLFIDTFPFTAHTTGSDALWAGLPVLTCQGTTFPGRVAASLLKAVGLPELIMQSLEEYEATALELATHPARLADIRARLERNRATHPLFDTDRSCRHIESAYVTMWERYQRGEPPVSFSVQPAGPA